jgi:predicted nucleic-acid-binding Zn-ribbon protein
MTMWKCAGCGEEVEDDFNVCWNCQRGQDGTPPPAPEKAATGALVETSLPDGNVEVNAAGKPLVCPVCGNRTFHERNSLLNTRFATFMNVDWANAQAVNYICNGCGYIFWFWPE